MPRLWELNISSMEVEAFQEKRRALPAVLRQSCGVVIKCVVEVVEERKGAFGDQDGFAVLNQVERGGMNVCWRMFNKTIC